MAKKKAPKPEGDVTLKQLAEAYLADLERNGKSQGTALSYRLEMVLAMAELGEETPIATITPDRVAAFFECDRVMRTRTGREKSPPTFLKTRRVFRQALVWAETAKWIEKAPLPGEEQPAPAN